MVSLEFLNFLNITNLDDLANINKLLQQEERGTVSNNEIHQHYRRFKSKITKMTQI